MAIEMLGNYDHLPPIPFIYGVSIIVAAVLFFAVLNYNVKRLTVGSNRHDDAWKWRNLFISWIHALIVGTWDLSCFYFFPELTTDLVAFNNMYIYALVAFSTGYFFYDFVDIVVSGKLSKTWEVVPHHIAVVGMFSYNVMESRCMAYNVVALLSEINTIFLHSRKLLQMHKWPFNHWLYRLNATLNLLTFVCCRFFGITWIVYGMFVYHSRVSRRYLCILTVVMFIMWITNLLLFWRLLQSDLVRPYFKNSRLGNLSRPREFGGSPRSTDGNKKMHRNEENICREIKSDEVLLCSDGFCKADKDELMHGMHCDRECRNALRRRNNNKEILASVPDEDDDDDGDDDSKKHGAPQKCKCKESASDCGGRNDGCLMGAAHLSHSSMKCKRIMAEDMSVGRVSDDDEYDDDDDDVEEMSEGGRPVEKERLPSAPKMTFSNGNLIEERHAS